MTADMKEQLRRRADDRGKLAGSFAQKTWRDFAWGKAEVMEQTATAK